MKKNSLGDLLGGYRTSRYHYCGGNSFEGMINSKSIWVNDLRSMNDPKENSRGNGFIDAFLAGLTFPLGTPSANFLEMLKAKFEIYRGFSRSFSFSTSTARDDLYSWINYGARGEGFCIGFDRDYFPASMWSAVIYDESGFKDAIERIWSESLKKFASTEETEHSRLSSWAAIDILQLAAAFKHMSWMNEQEERLLVEAITSDDQGVRKYDVLGDLDDYIVDKRVNYLFSGKSIKPYMAVDLTKTVLGSGRALPSPLTEVIIGPNNETAVEVVEYYLASRGFKGIKVTKSSCEFR